MTNEQYTNLWNADDGAMTFLVIDIDQDQDLGTIVASSFEAATALLERGIDKGNYSLASVLIEMFPMDDDLN